MMGKEDVERGEEVTFVGKVGEHDRYSSFTSILYNNNNNNIRAMERRQKYSKGGEAWDCEGGEGGVS